MHRFILKSLGRSILSIAFTVCGALLVLESRALGAERPNNSFKNVIEKYVQAKTLFFVCNEKHASNFSFNGPSSSQYFVAARKPNYLLIEEKYDYPQRKISCVRRFMSDGSASYETNSLYPQRYIRRPLQPTPNILANLILQYSKAPKSATWGVPMALYLFSLERPEKVRLWNVDPEKNSDAELLKNGVKMKEYRYFVSNAGPLGDTYRLDERYYADANNTLQTVEHDEFFENQSIKYSENYSQIEIAAAIPVELFRFVAKDYRLVEKFEP